MSRLARAHSSNFARHDKRETATAKTCETTNRENRLPGNRSANAVDSFRGVAAQESRPCRSYRNVLVDSG